MDWTSVREVVKMLAPVATAGAAWFAASIAYRGLNKWRSETLGKRKAEIAEATLASVYEMEEILRLARAPWVLPQEMAKKEGLPDEIATDPNYAPEARLIVYQDFFGRFRSQKYAFAAVFGRDAAKPIDELWHIRMEINWAVDDLLRNKEMSRTTDAEDRAIWEEWRNIVSRPAKSENDALGKRISEQVSAIEDTCRPAIEAREKPR
jgi:hypothetical protein